VAASRRPGWRWSRTGVPLPVVLAAAWLLLPAAASAQTGSIEGTVREAGAEGRPVATVSVQALSPDGTTAGSAATDAEGRFRIDALAPGTYTLRAERIGFDQSEQAGVEVRDGAATEITVVLSRRLYIVDPIQVTGFTIDPTHFSPTDFATVELEDIRERPAVTGVDHLRGMPAVDVISTGVQGHYVTVRGFNNIFSGATLTLSDFRIASVPSLRANVHHMNPVTNADIERVEVLLGPGSALFGPNAANGVIHTLTTSPLDGGRGSLSIASGVRQQGSESTFVPGLDSAVVVSSSGEPVLHLEGRYAHAFNDRFGVKVSGQFFDAEEWHYVDAVEAEQRALAVACQQTGYQVNAESCLNFAEGLDFGRPADVELLRTSVDNVARGRDNAIRRFSVDLRADWRASGRDELIVAAGRTRNVNSVDLTGLGAAQVVNWDSEYFQARGTFRDAFAQVYLNRSGNTESYLLRSGRPLQDRSYLLVSQVRNTSRIGDDHGLIYGLDFMRTVPRTLGTINGRHEDDDDITEFGGYVQAETRLTPALDLVAAARLDTHSRLEDPVFSPRAALVYRMAQGQDLRFTYNRAFSTPTTLNLFLDISGGTVPLGGPFRYDVRAQGATEAGMRFSRTDGIPDFMTPFALLVGGGVRQFRPTTTENLWDIAVTLVGQANPEAGALLESLPVPSGDQVGVDLRVLNLEAGEAESPFLPAPFTLDGLNDIDPLRPTITNTFEVGYRGLFGDERLRLSGSAYHTRIEDFTSALRVNSPNVFLNRADVQAYLQGFGVPEADAAALARSIGGEGEYGSADAPGIPLGVITPEEAGGTDAAIILTYENLGRVSLWGADLAATLFLGPWEVSGNVAWVSDDQFPVEDQIIPLNAPTLKGAASVRYRDPVTGLNGQVRMRHVGGFPANSAVYVGDVDAYTIFDLNLGYEIAGISGLSVQLDVQDVFDQGYRTFVGTPRMGRFALVRLRYEL
jgi:outer membrane receptor for ferrienterochelin and colicins